MFRHFALLILFVSIGWYSNAQLLPSFGDSRTGGSGMQFLKITPDARAMSLGGAGVATANDATAMYWNPAAITETDTAKFEVLLSQTRYFGDITANYAATVFKAGKLSYVGINVFSMQYGSMKETTEFEPLGTGRTFSVSNYYVGVTYAKILTNNFSFGLNGKFANEGFAGVNVNNVMFDLGLKYNVGVKNARFGINFSNFGLNVKPTGEVQILKFNGEQNITDFSTVTVPAIFRIGAAFDPIQTTEHNLSVIGQLNHPTDNNETYALAAEYTYLKLLHGRIGYEFASDAGYRFPSVGMGLTLKRRFGGIKCNVAWLPKNNLGNLLCLSIGVSIR